MYNTGVQVYTTVLPNELPPTTQKLTNNVWSTALWLANPLASQSARQGVGVAPLNSVLVHESFYLPAKGRIA